MSGAGLGLTTGLSTGLMEALRTAGVGRRRTSLCGVSEAPPGARLLPRRRRGHLPWRRLLHGLLGGHRLLHLGLHHAQGLLPPAQLVRALALPLHPSVYGGLHLLLLAVLLPPPPYGGAYQFPDTHPSLLLLP